MRAVWLLAAVPFALGGCRDQGITEPVVTIEPSFYNAAGAYWEVTTLADTDDGACDADCSLREAIAVAASGDEIRFAADLTGTIKLTDRLVISKDLTIAGPGATVLSISGENAYQVFRVRRVNPYDDPPVTASISGLTITNGWAPGGSGFSSDGGGIENYETLTLSQCVVSGNRALNYGGGIENRGSLTITRSTISGNYSDTKFGSGGGIHSSGVLAVLSITESTISDNYAKSYGGGIWASGILTLVRSTVSGNDAEGWAGGGGIYYSGYWGGASAATILNSTVSGNTAPRGAGINQYTANGVLRIILSTISGNDATNEAGGGGGGVHSDGPVQVKGSIIWGNTLAGTSADDVAASAATLYNSLGNNLIGAAGENVDFTQEFIDATDQTDVTDAGLASLADNGGPTLTHALASESPAIDKGTCTDEAGATVATDQRNISRPQGGACDIGAFELAASPVDPGEALVALIEASEDAGVSRGTVNKLRDALKHLSAGRTTPAVNELREYIEDVQSQSGKKLTVEEAEALIAAAEEIIETILASA